MQIVFISSNSEDDFEKTLRILEKDYKTVCILSCASNSYNIEKIDGVLQNSKLTIFGAYFPFIIYKNSLYEKGTLFIAFKDSFETISFDNISKLKTEELNKEIEAKYQQITSNTNTVFIFMDYRINNLQEILLSLFDNFGLDTKYIGGGAGSLAFDCQRTIFTNKGLLKDGVIIAFSKYTSYIKAGHGLKAISEPMKITFTQNKEIVEIDYEDALDVYSSTIKQLLNTDITEDNFDDVSKKYPFGIIKTSGEIIARTIMGFKNKSILLAENIPDNSYVKILSRDDELLNFSKNISKEISSKDGDLELFINCITRYSKLGNIFQKELDNIYKHNPNAVGILSLGEIANNTDKFLEIFNETIVLSKIEVKKDER